MNKDQHQTLPRLAPENCVLLICDLQEKFRPAIFKFDQIVANTNKLSKLSELTWTRITFVLRMLRILKHSLCLLPSLHFNMTLKIPIVPTFDCKMISSPGLQLFQDPYIGHRTIPQGPGSDCTRDQTESINISC